MRAVFNLIIAAVIVAGAAWGINDTKPRLRRESARFDLEAANQPPLYLPSARFVRLVAFGYENFLSHVLWFKTLGYFGSHYETDKDYRWLGSMCELVINLNPRAMHAYDFCATMLAWVARQPEKSTELLTIAIREQPEYWRYHYLRGFNYWYFLDRTDLAEEDLRHAASLPEAPPFLASLASRLIAARSDPSTAVDFLRDAVSRTADPRGRKALRARLRQAILARDLQELSSAAARYEEVFNQKPRSMSELVDARLLNAVPVDPWGKQYVIDSATGAPGSVSGRKPLTFSGETAATGLAANEE